MEGINLKASKLIKYITLFVIILFFALSLNLFVDNDLKDNQSRLVVIESGSKKVELYKFYTTCKHTLKQTEYEISLDELKDIDLPTKYPKEAGWKIETEGENIRLIQDVEGFCPEDGRIRYLGVENDYLAIYQGPSYLGGELLQVTNIKLNSLPIEWQEKIYNKSLEFQNESELFEALDSLDEYQ